jgi:type II secretory pathway component PulF
MEALNLNNSTDQSAMLYEVAAINRERDQIISCWRWGWLTPAIVCFVGMLIGLIVTGLFMPMVELISGLSS